jgi:hypothetical protein
MELILQKAWRSLFLKQELHLSFPPR